MLSTRMMCGSPREDLEAYLRQFGPIANELGVSVGGTTRGRGAPRHRRAPAVNRSQGKVVQVRLAQPGRDEVAVSRLMTKYLVWALAQLEVEYGIVDIPVDPTHAAGSLNAYHPPPGLLALAEVEGQIAGIGAVRDLNRSRRDQAHVRRSTLPPFRG